MKSVSWLLQTELKQSKIHFLLIAALSVLLGFALTLTGKAEKKISDLSHQDLWNADMVVLPKGITLGDFREELLSGRSTAFLPEAMFDTTVSMAKGQFPLTAVLAITDGDGPRVQFKAEGIRLGLDWLADRQKISPWAEQMRYRTPEWENKVISGFFASGTREEMLSLKELVDKRTVGQALFIKEQQEHDREQQAQIHKALIVFSGLLILLTILAFVSLVLWLKHRLVNTLNVFLELGFPTSVGNQLLAGLILISVLAPFALGSLASSFLSF